MNNIVFPENPTNGDVFEYSSGIYYQYVNTTKSWKKIVGLASVPLASGNTDGLMSKEDFSKLSSLMIPPPQTSLTADGCNTVFQEGIIKIESSNNDLNIISSLDILNGTNKEKVDFIIHENTFGIDFSINLNRLVEELEIRNKITYRSSPGLDGDQGPRGNPGRDRIETGPRGINGKDGKNAPYVGTLVQDFTVVDQTRIKKVVVDIKNDPDDPRKLIVVFGNIGNLSACPDRIHWKNKNTPWLVALKDNIGPCFYPSGCTRNICSTEICYIDTTTIQDQIKERFVDLLLGAKMEREKLVREWLNAMIEMFNAQKQALCCAIEAIDSKEKNQVIRDSWSMARYAASQSMYAFKLTSDSDLKYPRADPQQTPNEFLPNYISPEKGGAKLNGNNPDTFACNECFLIIDLLSYNIGQTRPISIDLPAGSYVSTIIQCCPEFEKSGSSGKYSVKFVDHDADGNIVTGIYTSINKGYLSANAANAAYTGESLAFKHYGGTVSFYLSPPPPNGSVVSLSGSLRLCVQPTRCFEPCNKVTPTTATGTNVTIPDTTIADLPASYIRASHAEFYERGWRTNRACAVHTSVLGTQFIVVFRSIGTDVSCGGGEYENTPFVKFFKNEIGEQVAIAWPTIDGNGFFGLPRDDGHVKIQLVYDKDLSDLIVSNINNDVIFKTIGNPKGTIKKVVVPILDIGYTDDAPDPSTPGDIKSPGLKWSFNKISPLTPRHITNGQLYNVVTSLGGGEVSDHVLHGYDNDIFNFSVGDLTTTLPTKAKCISLWFKYVISPSDSYIRLFMGDNYTSNGNNFILTVKFNGSVLSGTLIVTQTTPSQIPGLTSFSFTLSSNIPLNSWVHLTANRVSDKYIDVYVNGNKTGTIGPIIIGTGTYQYDNNVKNFLLYSQFIDQLRLYNDCLTAANIKTLYDLGKDID